MSDLTLKKLAERLDRVEEAAAPVLPLSVWVVSTPDPDNGDRYVFSVCAVFGTEAKATEYAEALGAPFEIQHQVIR